MTSQTTPTPSSQDAAETPTSSLDPQAHIARLQGELIALQRMALLGTMSAMAVHEFNNLMTPVVTRVQDALSRDELPAMRKALERTLVQAQKAIAITRHLLGLGGAGVGEPRACSVAAVVQEAIATATRPFEKDGIELHLDIPPELYARAQPILLEQLLLNLLLNAREAMKERGGPLAIIARREGDYVFIDVRDRGTGVSQERLDEVINPFLASDPRAQPSDWRSVGMGLNVCRTIAHEHGATIRATANDGAGCTFRIRWPAA